MKKTGGGGTGLALLIIHVGFCLEKMWRRKINGGLQPIDGNDS